METLNSEEQLIIEKNSFVGLVKQNGLIPIEVAANVKLSVQLSLPYDAFLQLVSTKSKELFYYYEYPEDHEIWITGKTFDEAKGELHMLISFLGIDDDFCWYIDEDIYPDKYADSETSGDSHFSTFEKTLKKEILAYNDGVDKTQFSTPWRFMAFYIDSGCMIGIKKEIPKPYISASETKLYSILSDYKDIIEENIEAEEQQKSRIREKLKELLLNDIQFMLSTNQNLRTDYAYNLWKNTKNKWIHEGFEKRHGGYPPKEYYNFIERVFKEMKYTGRKREE